MEGKGGGVEGGKGGGQMILEFHKLDLTGQAFRYARDRNGSSHLKDGPQRVDLGNLKANVDAVSRFLDAAWTGIDHCDPGHL